MAKHFPFEEIGIAISGGTVAGFFSGEFEVHCGVITEIVLDTRTQIAHRMWRLSKAAIDDTHPMWINITNSLKSEFGEEIVAEALESMPQFAMPGPPIRINSRVG